MSEVVRNLGFINSVVCPLTKAALLECNDAETIVRLKIAYPEAFPSQPIPVLMTWSEVRERWKEYSSTPDNVKKFHTCWLYLFDQTKYKDWILEFGIDWEGGRVVSSNGGPTVPPEIVLQLWRLQSLDTPIVVTYQGVQWLVGGIADEGNLSSLDEIHRFTTHENWGRSTLRMVPFGMIDMTK